MAGALGGAVAGRPAGAGLWVDFGALTGAGCFALSSTVFPTDEPAFLVASIESDKDVIMNTTAETVVALDNSVAEPRGPKAVCDPIPPNAPAKSAAFPLCKSTTIMRKTQTRM